MNDNCLNNNPVFAYKLFSTMGLGYCEMSDFERKLCEDIWKECNNLRSDVLIKCVQICGNVDSPLARYVRAKAWSWNLVCYSSNAISAIIDYLNHDLFEDSFKDNLVFDDYAMRRNHHLFSMYLDLGKAYEGAKKYDMAIEIYNRSKKFINNQIPYVRIAERYRIMKKFDEAISELDDAKNSKYAMYPKDNESNVNCIDLRVIDSYYKKVLDFKKEMLNDLNSKKY